MNAKYVFLMLAVATCCHAGVDSAMEARLNFVAEAATAMIDGDICLKIETPRSVKYAQLKDPRDPWRAGDNYDVDHRAFLETKKTLARLAHLCATPCDANLWMPVSYAPEKVTIVIRNVHEMSQFWEWGDLERQMPPEMKHVLNTGEQVTVKRRPGMVSVLAPVRNSLADVVALVEVVTRATIDPQENVK